MSVAAGTDGMTAARGVTLIVAYCIGLGLPFIILALGSARALTGVDGRFRSIIERFRAEPRFTLAALYGPEHGVRGNAQRLPRKTPHRAWAPHAQQQQQRRDGHQ